MQISHDVIDNVNYKPVSAGECRHQLWLYVINRTSFSKRQVFAVEPTHIISLSLTSRRLIVYLQNSIFSPYPSSYIWLCLVIYLGTYLYIPDWYRQKSDQKFKTVIGLLLCIYQTRACWDGHSHTSVKLCTWWGVGLSLL